jgi:hypothetical protein
MIRYNDRLRGARAAGGPDGIIGTKVGSRSSKTSLLIFLLMGSPLNLNHLFSQRMSNNSNMREFDRMVSDDRLKLPQSGKPIVQIG